MPTKIGKNYYDTCPQCGERKKVESDICRPCQRSWKHRLQVQNVILLHMSVGLNRTKIAQALHMSPSTVSWYWTQIMKRFRTRSAFKIAVLAKQAGII